MFKALSYIKTSLCCDDSLRVKSYQSHEFKFLAHRKTKIRQYIRRLKYSLMIKQSPLPILIVLAFTFVNSILWIVSLAEMCKIKHQSLPFVADRFWRLQLCKFGHARLFLWIQNGKTVKFSYVNVFFKWANLGLFCYYLGLFKQR